MTDTRFHSDPVRIRKQNEILTYQSRYMLDTPGPGANVGFQEDPHIRLTKWGANNCSQSTDIESDLRNIGVHKRLSHNPSNYKDIAAPTNYQKYGSNISFVEDTRISNPAWLLRDIEYDQWKNPQPVTAPRPNLDFGFSTITYSRNHRFL